MWICYDHAFLEIKSHCYYTIRPLKQLIFMQQQYILTNKILDQIYFDPTLASVKISSKVNMIRWGAQDDFFFVNKVKKVLL